MPVAYKAPDESSSNEKCVSTRYIRSSSHCFANARTGTLLSNNWSKNFHADKHLVTSVGCGVHCAGQRLDNPIPFAKGSLLNSSMTQHMKEIRAMQKQPGRWPLQLGGVVMLGAAMLHVIALFSGPGLVAALGAPPNIVESAMQGTWLAPVVISAIAILLFLVGFSALSTAGNIRPLPLARPLLYATSAVLLLRAAALPVILALAPAARAQLSLFEVMTGILCFVLGALFWIGLRRPRGQAMQIKQGC